MRNLLRPAAVQVLALAMALLGCKGASHNAMNARGGSSSDAGAGGARGIAGASSAGRDAGPVAMDAGRDAASGTDKPPVPSGHDGGARDAGPSPSDAGRADAGGSMHDAGGPRWAQDIHPLLVQSCGGCHGTPPAVDGADAGGVGPGRPGLPGLEGGGDAPGKFAVDDEAAAYSAVRPFVSPGAPDFSNLYIKISQDEPSTGGQRMPPALRQWDDASIALVHDWIAAGAHHD